MSQPVAQELLSDSMRWSGTTQYRILVGELASSDSREFERRVLPILRLAWPDAIPTPALNWLDQAGIDIMICTDPTGLFLNSLLVPLQNTSLHSRLRIRFAHRAYQEFFLSLFIRDNSSDFHGAELPEAIKRLLIDLETEGICDA